MSYLTNLRFWTATAERAAKTFAQSLLAALTVAQAAGAIGIDVLHINWTTSTSLAAGATILSVLTCIASGPIGPEASPSLIGEGLTSQR